jgi:hypothetical protein
MVNSKPKVECMKHKRATAYGPCCIFFFSSLVSLPTESRYAVDARRPLTLPSFSFSTIENYSTVSRRALLYLFAPVTCFCPLNGGAIIIIYPLILCQVAPLWLAPRRKFLPTCFYVLVLWPWKGQSKKSKTCKTGKKKKKKSIKFLFLELSIWMLSNLSIKYASCIPKIIKKNSLHCSKSSKKNYPF